MTQPYTYLIGWPEHNTWYYGVRYANNCMPSELWVSYKSSSKYVAEFAKAHGSPSITQVRKTFHTKDAARLWEHKVLKKLKVVNDEKWLNRTDNKAIVPRKGEEHHNATRRGKDSPFYGIARPEVAELKRKEWTKKSDA